MHLSIPESLHAAVGSALADVPCVSFAVVFGSTARGTAHAGSDVDVALGFEHGRRPAARELGAIVSRLEEAVGQTVDIIALEDASPGLAYRIFRIAHRYAALDWTRIHDVASNHIEDLLRICGVLADAAVDGADKS